MPEPDAKAELAPLGIPIPDYLAPPHVHVIHNQASTDIIFIMVIQVMKLVRIRF